MKRLLVLLVLVVGAPPAWCTSFDIGPISGVFNTRIALGAQMRVQNRDERLIGKLSVPGQQDLCAADDCLSFSGDPAPNQRLVDARGSFSGTNEDDGNLNYDRGDLTAAITQLRPRLDVFWGEWFLRADTLLFHDVVNASREERNVDTRFQPARSPRNPEVLSLFATGHRVGDVFATRAFSVGGQELIVRIGNQVLDWGEANLTQFNTLSEINPIDAPMLAMPGAEIRQLQLAAPLAVANLSLGIHSGIELMYQLQWRGAKLPAKGSLLSFNDIAGGGRFAMLGFGNFNEDPDRAFSPAGLASTVTQSSRTALVPGRNFARPSDHGQFGLRFNHFAEWLNDGTDLTVHFLRYHNRLPLLSGFAAEASCIRDATLPGFAGAFIACEGFNAEFNPIGREPLPVDTVMPFLDFPEGVQLYGLSFNTNVGDWALSGEYAYRPNQPLQILQSDVIFALLTPAFPEDDVPIGLGTLTDPALLAALPEALQAPAQQLQAALQPLAPDDGTLFVIPGAATAVPDLLSAYRGIRVAPGALIRGFERLKTSQLSLVGTRIFGPNPLRASQILFVVEGTVLRVHDMPGREQLVFEGAGNRTHPSPGADGTGSPDGAPNASRVNPTQMTEGFGDSLSFGYRTLARLTYDGLPLGMTLNPAVVFFHDVRGTSPAPIANFVEGRRVLLANLTAEFRSDWTIGATYQMFSGAGTRNRLRDRDNMSLFVSYIF